VQPGELILGFTWCGATGPNQARERGQKSRAQYSKSYPHARYSECQLSVDVGGSESQRLIPPSISNSAPTVNAASSEARNTTACAISLGCPNLPAGICLMNAACSSFVLPE
jgi:hypothetical protein